MRLAALVLIGLLPAVAAAQAPGDTVEVVVPADKDCGDFQTRMQSQGWFLFLQELTGERDPHRLDGDGDGNACSGIDRIRRVDVADSLWFYTEEHPSTLRCVDTTFAMQDYLHDAVAAMWGEGDHQELTKMRGCVDVLNAMQQVP